MPRTLPIFHIDKFVAFCEKRLEVPDRDTAGRVVPLKLYPQQMRVVEEFARQWNGPRECVRMLVLKDRRAGSTTVCQALAFYMGLELGRHFNSVAASKSKTKMRTGSANSRYSALLMTRRTEDSIKISRTVLSRWYEKLPDAMKRRGNLDGSNDIIQPNNGVFFVASMGLEFSVASSEDSGGRGTGFRFLLFSEYGYYKDTVQSTSAYINQIPGFVPGTVIIKESTGDNSGHSFETEFLDAVSAGKRADMAPVFFGFQTNPANSLDPDKHPVYLTEREEEEGRIIWTDAELRRQARYGLTDAQMNWWRGPYMQNKRDWVETTNSYPAGYEEAFKPSDSAPWDIEAFHDLSQIAMRVQEGGASAPAVLEHGALVHGSRGIKEFERAPYGAWRVFQWATPGVRYLVTCDPISGSRGRTQASKDECAIGVWELQDNKLKQAAAWNDSKTDPYRIAEDLLAIGMAYRSQHPWGEGPALMAIEANNAGDAVISHLRQQLMYPAACFQRHHKPAGGRYIREPRRYGYWANTQTKGAAYGAMAAMVREGIIEIYDMQTIRQMQTVKLHNSAIKSTSEYLRDDLVISAMWAAFTWQILNRAEVVAAVDDLEPLIVDEEAPFNPLWNLSIREKQRIELQKRPPMSGSNQFWEASPL